MLEVLPACSCLMNLDDECIYIYTYMHTYIHTYIHYIYILSPKHDIVHREMDMMHLWI